METRDGMPCARLWTNQAYLADGDALLSGISTLFFIIIIVKGCPALNICALRFSIATYGEQAVSNLEGEGAVEIAAQWEFGNALPSWSFLSNPLCLFPLFFPFSFPASWKLHCYLHSLCSVSVSVPGAKNLHEKPWFVCSNHCLKLFLV